MSEIVSSSCFKHISSPCATFTYFYNGKKKKKKKDLHFFLYIFKINLSFFFILVWEFIFEKKKLYLINKHDF